MGANVTYGNQKNWFCGQAFDGMFKGDGGDVKFGPTADFFFPATGSAAAISGSSVLSILPTVSSSGQVAVSSSSTVRAIPNTPAGGSLKNHKHWSNGLAADGLPKQDVGTSKYWTVGTIPSQVFPQTASILIYPSSSVSIIGTLSASAVVASSGSTVVRAVIVTGGAETMAGGVKHWFNGASFKAIREEPENLVKFGTAKFADTTLWSSGLPTSEIFPSFPEPEIVNPAKIRTAGMKTKSNVAQFPSSIKIISPRAPAR